MIQSLIGPLLHLSNAVPHARKFTSRIWDTQRVMSANNRQGTSLSAEFKADVNWFLSYAKKGNGLSLFAPVINEIIIECDLSLLAGGGNSDVAYYTWLYPESHRLCFPAIHHLLIACRTLCPPSGTKGKCILILTDNIASSYAHTSGQTKDKVLATCARELWLFAATADHDIRIEHRHGHSIPLVDALSRRPFDPAKDLLANRLISDRELSPVSPKVDNLVFFHDI